MTSVKLIVLLALFEIIYKCLANYCKICPNHTLCIFKIPGPSHTCEGYDRSALLTKNEIKDIVDKINERRNFVAMGFTKKLPEAANMRKIEWCRELAVSAQRWVDQCHPTLRPHKEDQCRDTVNMKIGQNIAAITGPAPGLSVKSFVETWFMLISDYVGSVSYYNKSLDSKTNYFTQLLWAETKLVGCGKARFFVSKGHTILERLVCNFGPKGNIHGKTVYAIGPPGTQCPSNMLPDTNYPGLCSHYIQESFESSKTSVAPVSSLLRILNLSNSLATEDADLFSKSEPPKNNETEYFDHRNQKIRHVAMNNTYAGVKYAYPSQIQNYWIDPMDNSRNSRPYYRQHEKGHSRIYHGHQYSTENAGVDALGKRRFDFTTESANTYSSNSYRRHFQNLQQCTRKIEWGDCNTGCSLDQCTRGQNNNCCQPACKLIKVPIPNPIPGECPQELCACSVPGAVCPPVSVPYSCKVNCLNANLLPSPVGCPNIQNIPLPLPPPAMIAKVDARKSGEFHYYDLMPNVAVRSGDENVDSTENLNAEYSTPKENFWSFRNSRFHEDPKNARKLPKIREKYENNKDVFNYEKPLDKDHDYLYGSIDSGRRKKRADQITFKPFWQVDEYNYKKPLLLKALRYTTLGIKKNRQTKKTSLSANVPFNTESITIKPRDIKTTSRGTPKLTEKFLSFEELMHLRKLSTADIEYDFRRKDDATTTTATHATSKSDVKTKNTNAENTTTVITANTPFERKKQCTRKVTCTWTAPAITDRDGKVIHCGGGGGGGGGNAGSRTPPGYVEGCTRTSTCTRDYMNRNKMPSSETTASNAAPEDEDYCEKRSLNVYRRKAEEKESSLRSASNYGIHTDFSTSMVDVEKSLASLASFVSKNSKSHDLESNPEVGCECNLQNSRTKRSDSNYNHRVHHRFTDCDSQNSCLENKITYGELFYLVLLRIMNNWKKSNLHHPNECQCNFSVSINNHSLTAAIVLFKLLL